MLAILRMTLKSVEIIHSWEGEVLCQTLLLQTQHLSAFIQSKTAANMNSIVLTCADVMEMSVLDVEKEQFLVFVFPPI